MIQSHEALASRSELNAVYAIARIVAESQNTDTGLDAIFRLARTIFILDIASVYLPLPPSDELEPVYARALGRGQTYGPELAWGDQVAEEAYKRQQTIVRHEIAGPDSGRRDHLRDYLGLPILVGGRCLGAMVFGRFGGPVFSEDQIRLAEFVAWHVGQLYENRRHVRRIASLEAQRELTQMQDEFIATISHELRTPLGFIKGYVSTLLRDDVQWSEHDRFNFLQIINDEADRLRRLIDDLLHSSRLKSGKFQMQFEPIRAEKMIGDVISRARSIYLDLEFELQTQDDIPLIALDAARISQVLDNLLINVHRYAPRSKVVINVNVVKDQLRIAISDNGPGIAAEHLPHIFERFYHIPDAKGIVRGTGLGLYISRKIIEAHGGVIGVQSNPGEGSTFFFLLPLTQEK